MANTTVNKWAVLIGVDYYINGPSRPGVMFHNLGGCVEDVNQVHEFLRESLGVRDSHICRLTATAPDDDSRNEPTEDPSRWPTYENIVEKLQKVSREAEPNDLVYLHYSGHGIRASTIFSDLKGDNGLDEALVPTNIACDGGRYIRDVEIAYLLQGMVKRGLIVTVVLDCCHSGGADRGHHDGEGNTRVRGIGTIDKNKLDSDISAFPHAELANATENSAQSGWRRVSVADHWLLGSSGYAFLAACQAQEYALEHWCGDRIQGLLTYFLLETLKNNPRELTYYKLWELVALKVAKQACKQHVVLGGEGDRVFFSSDRLRLFHAATVIEVLLGPKGQTTSRLNAGRIHGISNRMVLDVWPASCSNFSQSERLGQLSVTATQHVTADTVFTEPSALGQQLEVGCLALPHSTVSLQRPVRLLYQECSGEDSLSGDALNALREAWEKYGTTFAPLVDASEGGESFQVQVKDGAYDILNSDGQPLQHMVHPLRTNADNAPEKLIRRLTHLAKYYNVLNLGNLGEEKRVSWISVDLTKNPHDFPHEPRLATDPPSAASSTRNYEATADEWVLLRVTNTSGSTLNITVLDLDSSWAIEQIYPHAPGAAYETLDPRKTLYLPLQVTAPDGTVHSGVLDSILVFATVKPTNFRWLELAELDQETPRRGDHPSPGNALELLEAAMTLHEPNTRRVRMAVPVGWTVQHVTIEMNKQGDSKRVTHRDAGQ